MHFPSAGTDNYTAIKMVFSVLYYVHWRYKKTPFWMHGFLHKFYIDYQLAGTFERSSHLSLASPPPYASRYHIAYPIIAGFFFWVYEFFILYNWVSNWVSMMPPASPESSTDEVSRGKMAASDHAAGNTCTFHILCVNK